MASTVYPYPNNGHGSEPVKVKKCLTMKGNIKSQYPDGFIIAKGNIIEGIEAKE